MPWPGPVFPLQHVLELTMPKRAINPDLLPLTAEGFDEEAAFDAAQAKTGGQLRRIASGYVQTEPDVIRHFADYENMRTFVFSGGEPKNSKQPPQTFQTPDWLHLPHLTLENPATDELTSPRTNSEPL
jgi:hypothetical protein